jgi:hypothetical protein
MHHSARFLVHLTALAVGLATPLFAQDRTAMRSAYLDSLGLTVEAAQLEEFLLFGLEKRAPSWSQEDREREAESLAFVLTMNGVTLVAALAAQDAGLDVIHAIAANARPLVEQSLLADVVVIADAFQQSVTNEPGDGFEMSTEVAVRSLLKGHIAQDTLTIRQSARVSERNIIPELGGTYLLLLSRGMYRFRAATRGTERISPAGNLFNIYRIYRMADGRVLWQGYSSQKTEEALEEIRNLHAVLDEFQSSR